jgi:DNA-binding LacI/PurR family transcriptional regulator
MTIDEIAEMANVSKSAVSLALNGRSGVSEFTRQKVLSIAQKFGYSLNRLNSRKGNQENANIRLLICTTNNHSLQEVYSSSFFSHLLGAIENRSKQLKYQLIFSSCEINELEKMFSPDDTQGTILLATYCQDEDLIPLKRYSHKLVILDNYTKLLRFNCVNMDNFQGAYSATEYLINTGHRRIGIVKCKNNVKNFVQRAEGFYSCLSVYDYECSEEDVFSTSIDVQSAREEFSQYLSVRKNNMPTALFCECDYIALGVIKALHQNGYHVPDDVSVIGFDNVPEDILLDPQLTTVGVEKIYMGTLAVNRIHEMMKNQDDMCLKHLIDTTLLIRQSCRNTYRGDKTGKSP